MIWWAVSEHYTALHSGTEFKKRDFYNRKTIVALNYEIQ